MISRAAKPIAAALFIVLLGVAASFVWGAADTIGADEAWERARDGQLLIIDVRSPQEWRATGVPRGAATIGIAHDGGADGFTAEVEAAAGGLDRPIAVICARGGRSARATRLLSSKGFRDVLDISEGMLGGRNGLGWIKRGLPTEPYPRPAAAPAAPAAEAGEDAAAEAVPAAP